MPHIQWKPGARVFNKAIGIPGYGWRILRIGEVKEVTEKELAELRKFYGDAFDVVEAPKPKAKAQKGDAK